MVLTVDVGNTRIKGAVFEGYNTIEFLVFYKEEIQKKIEEILKKHKKITHLVVASVGNVDKNLFLYFQKEVEVWFVSHEDAFPFANN